MTKEITKAFILQEIQDKFKLRDLIPEKFSFSEQVIPTYDIGEHLLHSEVEDKTRSITAGNQGVSFFTVPENERWSLHGYNVIFLTGDFKVTGVMVYKPAVAGYFYLDMTLNQDVSYAKLLPQDVVLEPGDDLYIYIDAYVSTGNLMLRALLTVEEIR